MIYTCYEMLRDCREDRPEGWAYFIRNYVPVIRRVLAHYAEPGDGLLEKVLPALRSPQSTLFAGLEPAPERRFVAELRQQIIEQIVRLCGLPPAAVEVPLDELSAALEPLTVLEREAAWIETMRYPAPETAAMLRMSAVTVEKVRARAAEMLRARVDAWSRSALADNGVALGRAAAAAAGKDCFASKVFLDMLDGRTTWHGREQAERHMTGCWHCIDHFCRLAEVIALLRDVRPLNDREAAPYFALMGVAPKKRSAWKTLFNQA